MSGYGKEFNAKFEFVKPITTGTGTTTLVAAPGSGRRLVLQGLMVCVTTSAAQAFDVEDSSGTVEVFKAPASLAVGAYPVDPGPLGHPLTLNEALQYTATAGVGTTLSGFGYIQENVT
jgi:hypothetical protein